MIHSVKLFVIKEAIVFFFYYYSFITNFWLQRVIRLEFMQRLGDLVEHVDAITGQD